jgi:hypothetical protein
MAVIGGDIVDISVAHDTVGVFSLRAKSAEDGTRDLGGFRNTDDVNSVDGGGQNIIIKNRFRWMFEATISSDDNVAEDMQKIVDVAASPLEANFTFTFASGVTMGATGTFVGDIQDATNTATMTVKMSGAGSLIKL